MVVYIFALLSPLAFALGTVLQQRGTLETPAREGDLRFLAKVVRKPVWFLGIFITVVGFVLQAAALHGGSLSLVQALQALSLVFALPLGVRLSNQRVGRRSIVGAGITVAGLIVFVVLGQPQGGISSRGPRLGRVFRRGHRGGDGAVDVAGPQTTGTGIRGAVCDRRRSLLRAAGRRHQSLCERTWRRDRSAALDMVALRAYRRGWSWVHSRTGLTEDRFLGPRDGRTQCGDPRGKCADHLTVFTHRGSTGGSESADTGTDAPVVCVQHVAAIQVQMLLRSRS